ncbi:hypothetical protein [Mesorhizobium sp.]|uniref:hypothetical protein n=1 Tax=Mesorhizobium sp. TaxID=1871066 RepID=UPI0026010611|nr:hypothetical protein [Mesorhizobium sp.]
MSNAIPELLMVLRCHIAVTAPIRQSPSRGKPHKRAIDRFAIQICAFHCPIWHVIKAD